MVKRPRADIERARIGNRERAAGQECHTAADLIRLQSLQVRRGRGNLGKPAGSFLKRVAEGGKIGKIHQLILARGGVVSPPEQACD